MDPQRLLDAIDPTTNPVRDWNGHDDNEANHVLYNATIPDTET